jgi:TolA-binding protein
MLKKKTFITRSIVIMGKSSRRLTKTLYIEYEKLREGRKQHLYDLNSLQTKKSSLLLRIQELEEKLLEMQLQLEIVIDEKLTRMLSIQKSPTDKTGLGYVAPSSDAPSTSKGRTRSMMMF